MIVVADTSPLNYRVQISCDFLLPRLYRRILVSRGVIEELAHISAPTAVKEWLKNLPSWLEAHTVVSLPPTDLEFLGLGEREAIQLAEEVNAELVLIDERLGRTAATLRGLRVTGTLGVLLGGGNLNLIDPEAAYRQLIEETTFRISPLLQADFLRRTKK